MKKVLLIVGTIVTLIVGILIYMFTFNHVSNYKDIGNVLKDYNYKVSEELPGQKGPTDNFANIKMYKINGKETVSLLEYRSYYSAKEDLNKLSGPMADWITTPHFFWKSRFIIIYVGEDEKLVSDLEKILGNQYIPKKR